MPQHFVKIINRNTYTNQYKAALYVGRGLAEVVTEGLDGAPTEIRMLEAAELSLLRTAIRLANEKILDPVRGSFEWFVGDCGGSKTVKECSGRGTKAGVSGGYRVLKAQRGE
jgi:hypothetical protein